MSVRKVKTPAKMFTSDLAQIEDIVIYSVDRVDGVVGASLGPHGRNIIIESDLSGIPNKKHERWRIYI